MIDSVIYRRPSVSCTSVSRACRTRSGISILEITVVIAVLGVLAFFGVPRFLESTERSRAEESYKFLSSLRSAQERFQAERGIYCSDIAQLDMEQITPKYFSVGKIAEGDTGSLTNSWQLTLTRCGSTYGYGEYTVTFTDVGFDPAVSTIPHELRSQSDW